jgi:hypothetical protein
MNMDFSTRGIYGLWIESEVNYGKFTRRKKKVWRLWIFLSKERERSKGPMPPIRAKPKSNENGNMARSQWGFMVRRVLPKISAGRWKEGYGSDIPASQLENSLALNGRLEVKSALQNAENENIFTPSFKEMVIISSSALVQSRAFCCAPQEPKRRYAISWSWA